MPYKKTTTPKSSILPAKAQDLIEEVAARSQEQEAFPDEDDIKAILRNAIRRYFDTASGPRFMPKLLDPTAPVMSYDIDNSMYNVCKDIHTSYGELELISRGTISNFNYAQSEKTRFKRRISKLSYLTDEYTLLEERKEPNIVRISDNFNTEDNIDVEFGTGDQAFVSTYSGTANLSYINSKNRSPKATVHSVHGNGELGNYRIVREEDRVNDPTGTLPRNIFYMAEENPHDDPSVVLDGQPDTWVEYQMLNVPYDIRYNYAGHDFSWAKGKIVGNKLRLKLTIELESAQEINWIHLAPYLPPHHTSSKIVVHSISTSLNGIEYSPIYDYQVVLGTTIRPIVVMDPHDVKIAPDEDFANSKLAGQGIWNFQPRKAKFVEVVLDQDESRPEMVGIPRYERVVIKRTPEGDVVTSKRNLMESEVSQDIIDGLPGKYSILENVYIIKDIEVFEGWRYCLGVRSINIYSNTYSEQSELYSKKFSIEREIRALAISADEKIPDMFLDEVALRNEWIKYYISFNDIDWQRISPLHHKKLGNYDTAPKICLVNTSINPTVETNRAIVYTSEPAHSVRLKVVFSRPEEDEMRYYTPVLENYTISLIVAEEGLV